MEYQKAGLPQYVTSMLIATLGVLIFFFPAKVNSATNPEQKKRGLEIAVEMDKRDMGFVSQISNSKMILKSKSGKISERLMKIKVLEIEGDGDKSLVTFHSPRDVKGTSFLTFSHTSTSDDQWLFLPALKRVKRISSNNKSGPFMGSEFAYEDLSSQEVDKYTYKYLKDEEIFNRNTMVVERYPTYANSGYTKQVVWVDKERYIPLKVEYYDRKNEILKTLRLNQYKQYLEKYWRAGEMEMINHQTGKSTTISWDNFEFKSGLNDHDFTQNALKRSR